MYAIEDICTAFLPDFPDAAAYAPPAIGPSGGIRDFPSYQNGMVGLVKQIFDHAMNATAGGSSPFQIERMIILSNIAFIQKAKAAAEPPGSRMKG